jgi:hypothetical protein
MGERCNRTAEVRGSIPLSSTSLFNNLASARQKSYGKGYGSAWLWFHDEWPTSGPGRRAIAHREPGGGARGVPAEALYSRRLTAVWTRDYNGPDYAPRQASVSGGLIVTAFSSTSMASW